MKSRERKAFSFEEGDQTAKDSLDDLTRDSSAEKEAIPTQVKPAKKTRGTRIMHEFPPLPKNYITRSFHVYPETLEKLRKVVYETKKKGTHHYSQKEALKEAVELLMSNRKVK